MTFETQQSIDKSSEAAVREAFKEEIIKALEAPIDRIASGRESFIPLINLEPCQESTILFKEVFGETIDRLRDPSREETTKLKQREVEGLFGPIRPRIEITRYPIKGKGKTSKDNIVIQNKVVFPWGYEGKDDPIRYEQWSIVNFSRLSLRQRIKFRSIL